MSDADILLRIWEQYGPDGLARIEGEFAAAIFDRNEGRLVLAVDAVGLRSLYYARSKNVLAFATSPVPLARWRGVLAPDLTRLTSMLISSGDVGERSILEGVRRVRPGHVAICGGSGNVRQERWWTPDLSSINLNFEGTVEALRDELDRAVRTHVRTDCPVVAAQLSGGLDSSAVALSATDNLADGQRLVAITGEPVGHREYVEARHWFQGEAEYAAETAQMLRRTEHLRVRVEPVSPFESVDRWFTAAEYPLMNACNGPWMDATFAAAKASGAAQLLTGNLGNSTISHDGYYLLREAFVRGRWKSFVQALAERRRWGGRWRGVAAAAAGAMAPGLLQRLLAARQGQSSAKGYQGLLLRADDPHISAALQERRAHDQHILSLYGRQDAASAQRLADLQSVHLAAEPLLLRNAFGLEWVDPTAARRVVELCLRIPESYFLRGGERRAVARALLRGRVPDRVVDEQRKGEQGTNWRPGYELAKGVMQAEIEGIETGSELARLLDVPRIRQALQNWPADNWTDVEQTRFYRNSVMRAVIAARFTRWLREGAVGAS